MKNIIKNSILYFIFATSAVCAREELYGDQALNLYPDNSPILTGDSHIHYFDKDSIVVIETEEQLKELLKNSQGPSAISFHMDRCGWCIKMHPIFEALANDKQFSHITFYSVNGPILKAHTHTTNLLQEPVTGYPTMFFMNQGIVVDKHIGGTTQDVIMKKLTTLSNSTKPVIKAKQSKSSKQAQAMAKKIAATQAGKKTKKSGARKAVGAKIAQNQKKVPAKSFVAA